jgi:hypothetical protein
MKKNLRIVACILILTLMCFSPLFAATITNTVSDVNDDAYGVTSSSDNWTDDEVMCGYYSGYTTPYPAGAFRFNGIPLTNKTVILHAYLRVQAYYNGTGGSSFYIKGEDYDSTDSYLYEYVGLRAVTAASVSWNIPSAWAEDGVYTSPDIAPIVQEIVNRSGWASGNALAVQLRNTVSSGGYQRIYSIESAATYGASPAQLIIEYVGDAPPPPPPDGVKSENYIPGATNTTSSVPTYLNDPDMYYPSAVNGLCWASCTADIFAYWDRNPHNGVQYWNLVDNGTAPLLQPSLPTLPGHDQADVKTVISYLADQYYGQDNKDEKAVIESFANTSNGLSFVATYHGPVSSTAERTTLFGTIKNEINAGRPIGIGSWGTYFGGAHQVPVIGYKEMSNTVNSTVYIHRNTGGTESEYANPFASSWGNLDMDQIVPGGTPVDHYEAAGDSTASTTVSINPDDIYNFRQTHNFSTVGDVDWIRLTTTTGRQYVIETTNLGASCDTVLSIYANDGTTLIAQDDNGGGTPASRIAWRCWSTGTFLIKVNDQATGSGHSANYDVKAAYSSIVNAAPTNIAISSTNVAENRATGTTVGTFSASDPDVPNTFTYSLVSGSGSTDNGSFTVSGSNLLTTASFNYEVKNNYNIRIRTTDQGGMTYEKAFTVAVTDVTEPPPVVQEPSIAQNGSVVLRWSSSTNHLYTVYYSTNLLNGFSVLQSNIPATPAVNSFTDVLHGAQQGFWKISTEP